MNLERPDGSDFVHLLPRIFLCSAITLMVLGIVNLAAPAKANADKSYVTKSFTVQSFDPNFHSAQCIAPGQALRLNITDPDAVTDSTTIDTITLRAYSTSDPVGVTTSAIETGPGTGVFSTNIQTTTGASEGSVSVKSGDTLTIKYNDKYPADYATRVRELANPSEDFYFNVTIGMSGCQPSNSTSISPPSPQSIAGQTLSQVTAGQQIVLSTTINNNNPVAQPYAAIVEVRDSNDITVYLQWQTGTLPQGGSTGVGLSWTPDVAGTYTVHTFVVTDIANPQVLSQEQQSTLVVKD